MTRSQKEAIDNSTDQPRVLDAAVEDAIRDALEALLGNFKPTPSGPLQMQPATRQTFKLTPSPSGLGINVAGLPFLPVTVEVTWKVFRDQDGTLKPLSEGSGFDATPDLNTKPAEAGILFFPLLSEDVTGAAATAKFAIRISVKGSVTVPITNETIAVGPINLPDIPVTMPVVLVPTVLVFFRHKDFQTAEGNKPGFALITVPVNSAIRQLRGAADLVGSNGKLTLLESQLAALVNRLNGLSSQVQSLAALASKLAVFLTGLRTLKRTLADPQMAIGVCPKGANDNLNTITLIQRGLFANDIEAESEPSSIIAIGVPGQAMRCYNKRHFETEQGVLGITLGTELCALINNLDVANPVSNVGNAEVRVIKPARIPLRRNTFDNAFSSFHFGNTPPRG